MFGKLTDPSYSTHIAQRRGITAKYKKMLKSAESKSEQQEIKRELDRELRLFDKEYNEPQ